MRRALLPLVFACASCATAAGPGASKTAAPAPDKAVATAAAQPPTPPPDPDAPLKRDVLALRDEAVALLKAQAEVAWKAWALGEDVDVAAAFQGHDALCSVESIKKVRALREKTRDPEAGRGLRLLQRYLEGEALARATADPSDALAHLVATSTIAVEQQEFPYRELESLLANEGHTGKRRKLFRAADPVVRKLEGPLATKERKLAETAAALGYPSPLAFVAELREIDPAALEALARKVLERTEAAYLAGLEGLARRELSMPLSAVRRADVPRLLRTGDVDTYFTKEKALDRLLGALARMGIDPAATPQLKVDGEARLRKSPRALAIPVEAGKDVRLSVRPMAGLTATAQLFHEAGHAVLGALSRTEAPELKAFGSGAVAEAAGYLLEGLLEEPAFAESLGVPPAKLAAHAKASALRRLLLARRSAARILFELAWRRGLEAPPEDAYRELMAKALGFPADPEDGERWMSDTEDSLAAADHLLGLLAAAQLDAALSAELGPQWWADARAAARLSQWLAPGGRLTLEGLAQATGAPGLDPEPFAARLDARLGPAPKAAP